MSAAASASAVDGMTITQTRGPARILHVAEVIKGGICTYLREIVALQQQSFGAGSITVVIPASQRTELQVPLGVELLTFNDQRNRVVNALRLARVTHQLVARLRPDIVHIHSTFAGAVLRPMLAAMRCPATIIYCPHGWAFQRDSSRLIRHAVLSLERVWSRWCNAIVCVSDDERVSAIRIGIPAQKLVVVRNGLPKSGPNAEPVTIEWPSGARRLLFVGRFDRQKGIDILFEALRELGDEAFAYIAGDSLRASLGEIPGNARYAGWLTPAQLESYYRTAEVVVMPSRWEGLPLVALEAMRAGVTLIATTVGGLPEIVEHGKTGLLIDSDDKNALVAALRGLERGSLRAMGEAARQRFLLKFTIDSTHVKLCALYRQCGRTPASNPDMQVQEFDESLVEQTGHHD